MRIRTPAALEDKAFQINLRFQGANQHCEHMFFVVGRRHCEVHGTGRIFVCAVDDDQLGGRSCDEAATACFRR